MDSNTWIERIGCTLLRGSLAAVFLWFGLLKLAGLCPLDGFICRTLPFLPSSGCPIVLGGWEAAIGICLLFPPLLRWGLLLLLMHLPGTFLPLIVLPHECFAPFPYGLTLEGQYIVKNLVLASAALVVAGRYHTATERKIGALKLAVAGSTREA